MAARATTGAFVAFLDADDFYYPRRLEALAELASAQPELDVLTTNADLEVDGVVRRRYYPDVAGFPVQDQALAVIGSDSAIFGAAAVRRSDFEGAGGLNESLRSGDDWELWIGSRSVAPGSASSTSRSIATASTSGARAPTSSAARGTPWRCSRGCSHIAEPASREQVAIEQALEAHLRNAALTEAEHALRIGAPDRRSRSLAIAFGSGFGAATRAKALLAAAFPGPGRLLERREAA